MALSSFDAYLAQHPRAFNATLMANACARASSATDWFRLTTQPIVDLRALTTFLKHVPDRILQQIPAPWVLSRFWFLGVEPGVLAECLVTAWRRGCALPVWPDHQVPSLHRWTHVLDAIVRLAPTDYAGLLQQPLLRSIWWLSPIIPQKKQALFAPLLQLPALAQEAAIVWAVLTCRERLPTTQWAAHWHRWCQALPSEHPCRQWAPDWWLATLPLAVNVPAEALWQTWAFAVPD